MIGIIGGFIHNAYAQGLQLASPIFEAPVGIAWDPSTHAVFVLDSFYNRIVEIFFFNPGCTPDTIEIITAVCFDKAWGSFGTADGEFFNPKGLAVDSSGKLYVADTFNNRIQEFQLITPCPAGAAQIISGICFIKKWDSFGQFKHPQSVAVDTSNHIVFVADTDNHKVHNHGAWGTLGTDDGEFKSPRGLAVNPFSHKLFVADTGNHRIQEFEFVSQFTGDCSGGIQIDSTNACFIRRWP